MHRSFFVLTLLPLFASKISIFPVQAQPGDTSAQERPNIVMIVADDLDPHHLGAYGGNLPTPNLDRLAATGLRFNGAYTSSPACTPSRYSLLTGQYAGRSKHPEFLRENPPGKRSRITWRTPLSRETVALHEMLSEAGYFTAFVGKYHVGPSHTPPLPRDLSPAAEPADPHTSRLLRAYQQRIQGIVERHTGADTSASVLWANYPNTPLNQIGGAHNVEWMTNGAIPLLEHASDREQPFFLYLATTPAHGPNLAATLDANPHVSPAGHVEAPYRHHSPRDSVRARLERQGIAVEHYSAGLALLDDQVGAVLDRLRALGLRENTLVVFVADHGTEPGKATTYEQGVRVPLLVRWPGHTHPGSTDRLVQLTDFWPTLADLAGAASSPSRPVDGISFAPLLRGLPHEAPKRDHAYFEMGYARALSDGTHKYVALRYPDALIDSMRNGSLRLAPNLLAMPGQVHSTIAMKHYPHYFDANQFYNLDQDPYEQRNLMEHARPRDALQRMRQSLKDILTTFERPFPLRTPAFMQSDTFRSMARRRRADADPGSIPWWPKEFTWPPRSRTHALRMK
jgi:arylsulfatase A-like enzyme